MSLGLFLIELWLPFGIRLFISKIGLAESDRIRIWEKINDFSLNAVLLMLAGLSVIRGALQWSQNLLGVLIGESLKFRIRTKLIRDLFRSFSGTTDESLALFGELSNNCAVFCQQLSQLLIYLVVLVMMSLALLKIDAELTVSILGVGVSIGAVLFLSSGKLKTLAQRNQNYWQRANRRISHSIKVLPLIRIYGLERAERRRNEHFLKSIKYSMVKSAALSGLVQSIPQVVGLTLIFLVIGNGNFAKKIPPGTLIAYIFLTFRLFSYATYFFQSRNQVIVQWPHVLTVMDWWHRTGGILFKERKHVGLLKLSFREEGTFGWDVTKLSYQLPETPLPLFQNLNFVLKPGGCLAVTGESGSGKSTLINILLGIIPPSTGSVSLIFRGRTEDLGRVGRQFLRRMGYVGPESFLVEGTLYENLIFGLLRKPAKAEITRVLKLAECDFIQDKPNGLNHRITEQGEGLSQGQKQRLCLARALLRSPSALILDEATANLDLETERSLIKTFSQLRDQVTLIVVTHKLDLVQLADIHIHLDAGSATTQLRKAG